jgi:hypothetical protein
MISCDQCRSELAELALGDLPADASAAVAEHLAACPVCRHESAALAAAWASLPMTLPPSAPPADLFDRIAARLDDAPEPPPRTATRPARQLTRGQRIGSYVLAASLFIGLTATFFRLTLPSPEEGAAIASIEELARRLGELQRREAERLLQSERVRIVSLHSPQPPDSAEAYVIWDLVGGQWHFFASSLLPAPAGQTYQLWAAAGADPPLPGPTFAVNDQGLGSAVADFPNLAPGVGAKAIVTLEPFSGSTQPTGKIVLEAAL